MVDTKKLSESSISKTIFKLSIPVIVAQIANALYSVVDRMYIGHIKGIGSMALTGVGLTFPLITIIAAFSALIGAGGAPRASIMLGRKEDKEAERIVGNCFSALVIISIFITVLFLIFSKGMLMMFGGSEKTIIYALPYMKIYSLGTVFVQITLGMNAFITAQGYTKVSMMTVIIGAVTNIVLDPLFIFAFGLGVKGAAIATVISQAISCIWVILFLTVGKSSIKIRPSTMRIRWKTLLPCLALGISPFVMQFTESILFVAYNSSLYKYGGDMAVGAMTILSSIMQFSLFPLTGLTQGAQPVIGYNFGAGNADNVKKAFKTVMTSAVIYCFVLWASIMLFPQMFIKIFTGNKEMIAYTITPLRIYMGALVIYSAQIACQNTFVAIGNAFNSVILAIVRKIILLIPMIYILPHLLSNKERAVFLAEPVSDLLAVTTTVIMFTIQFRKALRRLRANSLQENNT